MKLLKFVMLSSLAMAAHAACGADTSVCPLPLVSAVPTAGATDVPVDTTISVTFSKQVKPFTVTPGSYSIEGVQADVHAICSTVFIVPAADLSPDSSYTVATRTCGVPNTFVFTTGHAAVPTILASTTSRSGPTGRCWHGGGTSPVSWATEPPSRRPLRHPSEAARTGAPFPPEETTAWP
jgi:hypothetical protein